MLLPYVVPFTGDTAVARNFSSIDFLEETIEIKHNNTRVWHLSAQSNPQDIEQIYVTYIVGPIDLSTESIVNDPRSLPVFELYFLSYNFEDREITQQGTVATSVFPFEYELHVVQGGELDGFIYISYVRFNEEISADVENYNPSIELAWSQDGEAWQTRRVGGVEYTLNGTLTITEDERGVSQLADVKENETLVFSELKFSSPDSFISGSGIAYTTWSSLREKKEGEDNSVTSTFLSETNLLEGSVDFKLLDVQGNDFDNNESKTISSREYRVSTIVPLPDNEILVSTVIRQNALRETQVSVHKISLDGLAEEDNGTALSEKSLLGRWPNILRGETLGPIIRASVVITDEGYNVVFSASGNQGVKLFHLPSNLTSDDSAEWTQVRLEEKLRITLDHVHAIVEEDNSISAAWSVHSTLAKPFSGLGFISNYDQENMEPVTGTFVNETLGVYRTGLTLFRASEVPDSRTGLIWVEVTEPEEGQFKTILKYDDSLRERVPGGNVVWAFLLGLTLCLSAAVAAVIVIRLKT